MFVYLKGNDCLQKKFDDIFFSYYLHIMLKVLFVSKALCSGVTKVTTIFLLFHKQVSTGRGYIYNFIQPVCGFCSG